MRYFGTTKVSDIVMNKWKYAWIIQLVILRPYQFHPHQSPLIIGEKSEGRKTTQLRT